MGKPRGETQPQIPGSGGAPCPQMPPQLKMCRDVSRKETVPNPSAEPFPVPAGGAAVPGVPWGPATPPRGTAGIPSQNNQVPPRPGSVPCFLCLEKGLALVPKNPSHSRRQQRSNPSIPSLLPARLRFLKLKGKKTTAHIPGKNFKLLESRG